MPSTAIRRVETRLSAAVVHTRHRHLGAVQASGRLGLGEIAMMAQLPEGVGHHLGPSLVLQRLHPGLLLGRQVVDEVIELVMSHLGQRYGKVSRWAGRRGSRR